MPSSALIHTVRLSLEAEATRNLLQNYPTLLFCQHAETRGLDAYLKAIMRQFLVDKSVDTASVLALMQALRSLAREEAQQSVTDEQVMKKISLLGITRYEEEND